MNNLLYVTICIHLLLISPTFQTVRKTHEQPLFEHLFTGYNKEVRPVIDNKPVNLTFGLEFIQITSVDERSQRITIKAWMRMKWKNEAFLWDPRDWNNITIIKVPPGKVWKPDIVLYDEVDESLTDNMDAFQTLVHIYSSGNLYWSSPTMFTSSCHINVKNFPFDFQMCKLKYGSWGYDQSEMDIYIDDSPPISEHYVNHTEWDIENITYQRNSISYSMHANKWVDITIHFTIHRKPLYYMMNVVVPCVILMAIILMSFFLPPESGERAAIVITVLLAFTVYLHLVSQSLPTTSDSSPVLSVFYITIMAESAFSLCATGVVLVIHHRGSEKGVRPLPNWVKYWFIDYLAKKLGVIQLNLREYNFHDLLALSKSDDKEKNSMMSLLPKPKISFTNGNMVNAPSLKDPGSKEDTMDKLLTEVTVITQLIHDMNRQDEIEEEWQFLGKVLDRIFFLFFLVLFLVSSIAILIPGYLDQYFASHYAPA